MTTIIQTTDLQSQITAIMSQYMNSYMQTISSSLQKEMQRSMISDLEENCKDLYIEIENLKVGGNE